MSEKQVEFSNIINSLTEEFNQKLQKVRKKLDNEFEEIKKYYSGMMSSLQMQLLLNKMSENKIKELEEIINNSKIVEPVSEKAFEEYEEEQFKNTLKRALDTEQKINNSIGYPKQ